MEKYDPSMKPSAQAKHAELYSSVCLEWQEIYNLLLGSIGNGKTVD